MTRTLPARAFSHSSSPCHRRNRGRQPPYDGRWSLSIVTKRGTCDAYNFPVEISNGNVTFPGLAKANGRVTKAAFGSRVRLGDGQVGVRLGQAVDVVGIGRRPLGTGRSGTAIVSGKLFPGTPVDRAAESWP